MPPRRRGRPSLAQKSSASSSVKEGISVGLVTDEEEEENALGGATIEFVPLALNDEAPIENVGNQGPDAIVNDEVGGDAADLLEGCGEENDGKNTGTSIVLSPRRGAKRKAKDESVKKRKEIIKELKASQKDENIDIGGINADEDDGMEEDEEAILEAMDAEDAAAAEVENDEKIGDKENTKTDGDPNKTAEKTEKPTKVCHICGHKAQSYVSLRNHIMARHEKKKPYLCEICGYAATLESTVERHKRVKHAAGKGSMNIQCPKCDYKCSSKQHLKSHDLIVHVEGATPFECGVCAYQCRRKPTVLKHMKYVHEGSKPFECPHCQRRFPKLCVMNKHIEHVHEKVRPYACDICGHPFSEKRYLEKHIQVVHEKIKPIKCKLCDYRCALPYNLQDHIFNKHTRERPHACDQCPERFLKVGRLAAHKKEKHGMPFRPYSCDKCEYATDKKKRLQKHMLSEHIEAKKLLRCKECGMRFHGEKRLATHMESQHGKKATSYVVRSEGDEKENNEEIVDFVPDKETIKILEEDASVLTEVDKIDHEQERLEDVESEENQQHNSLINPQGDVTQDINREEYMQEEMQSSLILPTTPKKRKKLSLATTEGEIPGEVIEVVGADDEVLTGKPAVRREKVIHINKLTQEDVKKMKDAEDAIAIAEKTSGTKFLVRTQRGDSLEPVVFEIEIKEETRNSISTDRIQEDAAAVVNFLTSAETMPGVMDSILSNIDVKAKDATEDEQEMDKLVRERGKAKETDVDIEQEMDESMVTNKDLLAGLKENATLEGTEFDPNDPDAMLVAAQSAAMLKKRKLKKKRLKNKIEKKVFLCDECGYSCTAMHTLNVHRTFKHGPYKEGIDGSKTLKCEQDGCSYTCVHPQHLEAHKKIVHEDNCIPIQCERCAYQCRGDREMNTHMRAVHDDIKPFVCKHCDRAFNKKSNMVKHVKMVHEKIKPYPCDECGRCFADKRDVRSHIDAVHRKLKPFACTMCDARCARQSQLKVHIANVHATAKPIYECGECGQRFVNKNLLNLHNKAVHTIMLRAFDCQYCDYRCTTRTMMETHQKRRHTKEKVHCQTCGQAFMSDRKLQAHMRLEHEAGGNEPGAKNYVCDWCDYAGATQVHLTNHVKSVHENVRRHKCNQCDFTSYATTALKRHVAAVHERKKPFACNECSFRTAYKDSLELHMNNVHKHGPRKVRTRQQQNKISTTVIPNDMPTIDTGDMEETMTEMMLKHDGQVTVQDTDGGMSVITVGEVGDTVIVGDVIHTVDAKDVHGVVDQISGGRVQNIITTADGAQVVVSSDQNQEETVTATEDLMALVGIGAANVVQEYEVTKPE